jgi:hypothetical protein
MNQMALSFVQTRARRTDCATSHEAAKAAVTRKADAERAAIRQCVKAAPSGLTAREISQCIGVEYIETQRRISECGLTKTDMRRDKCAVWMAV